MRAMILVLFLTVAALAQPDTVRVAGDLPSGEGNLNRAIRTAAAANDLAHTAFLLERGGRYVLSESIIVPAGQRLTLIAPEPGQTPESRPPLLCWSAADNIDRRFLFDCFGDITLKNIWLFYATTAGWQTPSSLQIEDDPAADTSGKGEIGLFENVLFDYAGCPANASGAVGISAKHFHGTFRNCYFRNCADLHLSYYGRAVSFPFDTWGWHIDSLSFENCTFANLGYVYMQENDEYADFIQLNHCTILNTVMFPLERGMWHRLAVTNSIFFNTWMYGDIPAFTYPGRGPHGGTIEIDSLSQYPLSLPFAEEERHILFSHSSYFIETWLSDWMRDNPYSQDLRRQGEVLLIPHPQPMLNATTRAFFESERYPFINQACLHDSTDPEFITAPTNREAIKTFIYFKWFCCCDTNWAWEPLAALDGRWPLPEDLAYRNPDLLSAGMAGFPLGDLYHWFPDDYPRWLAQRESENQRISAWLESGIDPLPAAAAGRPLQPVACELFQNYPNPFNAITRIVFSVPVDGTFSLRLYTIAGQEAAVLFSGFRQAGTYSADLDGRGLASGIYLYQLQAHGNAWRGGELRSVVRKLALVR